MCFKNSLFQVSSVAFAVVLAGAASASAQQVPATAPSQAIPASAAPAAASVKLPSALLQPGIDAVRTAVSGVRLDKWKAPEAVRDEADANMTSIRRDLDNTLPGLLATADAAPGSVVQMLPAYRNVEALYDVLLRVVVSARMAAPAQQTAALDQAMSNLDAGRRGLADRIQVFAAANEKQVSDLKAALKAAQTPPPAPAPVAAPVTPVKKKKVPAAKPAAKTPPPATN